MLDNLGQVIPKLWYQTNVGWPWLVLFGMDRFWNDKVRLSYAIRTKQHRRRRNWVRVLALADYFRNYFSSIFEYRGRFCSLGGFLLNDGLRFPSNSTLKCFSLPIDGPPPNLLGAPWTGPGEVLHLFYPELTGMGENCNTFIVLEYFTDVLNCFFDIVEQLNCFLILQCLSSANFDDRRICSFHLKT